MQCDEQVYSIRRVTSAEGGQGMWCEKKVCIITVGRGACKILPLSNQYECPKIFQNGAQTPEHPKIHKHLIHEHL